MVPRESIHERRRKAYLHYFARAKNARFSACFLWHNIEKKCENILDISDYGGDPKIAIRQAFLREMAIALELIIKALIARKIELSVAMKHVTKVKSTHDLVALWKDAGLPDLPKDDHHRLQIAKSLLQWSGRYLAPNSDQQYEKEVAEQEPYQDVTGLGDMKIYRGRSLSWEDFDRIFQIVFTELLSNMDSLD